MMLRDEILALAAALAAAKSDGTEEEDFLAAFGFAGCDANDFLEAFAEQFHVNLDAMLWYFHYDADEPPSFIQRVRAIDQDGNLIAISPITLTNLVEAAKTGEWVIQYPQHTTRRSLWSRFGLSIWAVMLFAAMFIFALVY